MTAVHKYHEFIFRTGPAPDDKRLRPRASFFAPLKSLRLTHYGRVITLLFASFQIFLLGVILRAMHCEVLITKFLPTQYVDAAQHAWDTLAAVLR